MEKVFLVAIVNYLLEFFGYEIAPIINELEKAKANKKKHKRIFRHLESSFQPNFSRIAKELNISTTIVSKIANGKATKSSFYKQVSDRISSQLMEFDNFLKDEIKIPLLPHKEEIIRLFNIEFDLRLINIAAVSKSSGFSYAYTYKLLTGSKKNPKALWKLRHTIVKLYGSPIKYIPFEPKFKSHKAA